jgi:N-acyl-L-homoserine lactone synthetase
MVLVVENVRSPLEDMRLRSMFEGRKRVFVDLLKWDVAVVAGRYELDQFDDDRATYLVLCDRDGTHQASARLLETETPHILDTLFRELCAGAPPRGEHVLEITRFCLARAAGAERRLLLRNALVSAIVDYALLRGITAFTGVAEIGWLQQILSFGWRCRPLGPPRLVNGKMLGALQIAISRETPRLLAAAGIYTPAPLHLSSPLVAA